ncbi:TPA: hypothetical protein HA253_03935 [Candidatus Woesearchaeota archaeon]|nr:hypothetical protein [Candidatus Woesearchaeota archaeon]
MDAPSLDILDKYVGTLIGLAIGDAFGMPMEFLTREEIQRRYGEQVTRFEEPFAEHPNSGLRAGLSGVYSDRLFGQSERPLKYYGEDDIKTMKALTGIDVLLTHEAPIGVGMEKDGKDLGRQEIREIIEQVQPRLAVFGHHHVYREGQIGATRVIGLQQPKHSYVVLDTDTFSTEKVSAELSTGKMPQWTYAWER